MEALPDPLRVELRKGGVLTRARLVGLVKGVLFLEEAARWDAMPLQTRAEALRLCEVPLAEECLRPRGQRTSLPA